MKSNATHAQLIPLDRLVPSRTNPRKHFDKAALDELTESVRKHGVLQPVLVRPFIVSAPLNKTAGDPDFILVAGERRLRAAKAAGLASIPAVVRELSTDEALELQVVENLQRADLHPLEEAEGYEALLKCQHADGRRYTVDEIAAKVGKSKAYVYARMKLCALCPSAREAFFAGKLTPSTALLIARIPGEGLQKKALKEITEDRWNGMLSYRQASEHVQHHYMLQLSNAPFPTGDAELLPKAGACTACPKRSGNQPELFGDVKGADVCSDPECFERKRAAHVERLIAAAKAKGQEVIAWKDAKKLISYRGDDPKGYVRLDRKLYGSGGQPKTVKQVLGKDLPPVTLFEEPETGNLIEVVREKDAAPLLKPYLGRSRGSVATTKTKAQLAREKAQRERQRLEAEIRKAVYMAGRAHAATVGLGLEDLRDIARECWARHWHDWKKVIAAWWIPDAPKAEKKPGRRAGVHDRIDLLGKKIATMDGEDLIRLLLDCALVGGVMDNRNDYVSSSRFKNVETFSKRHGVDSAAIRKQVTAAAVVEKVPEKRKGAK